MGEGTGFTLKTYPDPSVLVAAYVEEPCTGLAIDFLRRQAVDTLLTSWWTYTEITSALGVKARTGGLDAAVKPRILASLRRSLERTARTVAVVARDFEVASDYMERVDLSLRGGDALHLAIAARHEALVWTFDLRMMRAGQALGLDTRLLA